MPLVIVKTWKCLTCDNGGTGPASKSHGRIHATYNKKHQVDYMESYVWVTGRQPNYNGLHRG